MANKRLENNSLSKLDGLYAEINELIKTIREYIQVSNQEMLLMAVHDIYEYSNPETEGEILIFKKNGLPLRPIEYLQSIIAATDNVGSKQISDDDIGMLAQRFLSDYEELFRKSNQYLMLRGILSGGCPEQMNPEIFEAQYLHMVRGNRYRFLQLDYISPLLLPHDDQFQKLFGLSSNDVINGYKKLEIALSNGRLDGINKFIKLFDRLSFDDEPDFSSLSKSELTIVQEASLEAFSVCHFNVQRITGWPKEFIQSLSYKPGEASFYEEEHYKFWPIVTLPIQERPFITLNEETYCFDYYSLTDNFYRSVQKAILRIDANYQETWQEKQKDASEEMARRVLEEMLPGCVSYIDNFYGTKKNRNENDLLIQYRDSVIVVEVKAGRFTDAPPISGFGSHINHYVDLIQKSNEQCDRMRKYIENSGDELVLYDEDMNKKVILDLSGNRNICCLSITIENINSYAARAEKLEFLNLNERVTCMAIDDLMTYREYFDNPLEFLHFLKQREIASQNKRLALNDELDHLGMYIAHNCYSMEVDDIKDEGSLFFSGYRDELDDYFDRVGTHLPLSEKPHQEIPTRLKEIIQVLESTGCDRAVWNSSYLLDFSSDARQQLSDGIDAALARQSKTGRQCAISFSGKEDSIRLTYFVFQDELTNAQSEQEIFDYAASLLIANDEKDRVLMALHYGKDYALESVSLELITKDSIPAERFDTLKDEGELRGNIRVAKYIEANGKIGRNELCPCGSGKKYKKCHGRSI